MRTEDLPGPGTNGQTTRRQASPQALRITARGFEYLLELHAGAYRWCRSGGFSCQEASKLLHARAIAQRQEQGRAAAS